MKELGCRINPYDRRVLTLDAEERGEQVPARGAIVIEVDDVLEAGDEEHRRRMKVLEEKLRFGKAVELQSEDLGTGYAGRRIRQEQDCSFTHSMQDYVQNRLKQVILENKTLKKNASEVPLTANEETQLRGTIASINWIAREGRPDASAAASILAGCLPNPCRECVGGE